MIFNTSEIGIPISANLQTKSASYAPSESQETDTVTPDSGYDGLSQVNVTVNAISSTYIGSEVTKKDAATYHPDPADRAIASATYLRGAQTIKGVRTTNLTAANIKKGVTIEVGDSDFSDIVDSVTGTYEGDGAANIVEGTFTTGNSSGSSTLTLPYTGSGYPIGLMVWPEGGAYNSAVSPWYNSITRYAVGFYSMTKAVITSAPTYTSSGTNNYGCVAAVYKNSTSTATTYSRTSSMTVNVFGSSAASNSATTTFRFLSATQLSYYVIGSSSYGLLQGQTYHYLAIYSE